MVRWSTIYTPYLYVNSYFSFEHISYLAIVVLSIIFISLFSIEYNIYLAIYYASNLLYTLDQGLQTIFYFKFRAIYFGLHHMLLDGVVLLLLVTVSYTFVLIADACV